MIVTGRRSAYAGVALLAWAATSLVWLKPLIEDDASLWEATAELVRLYTSLAVLGVALVATDLAVGPDRRGTVRAWAHLSAVSMVLLAGGVNAVQLNARVGPGLEGAVDAVQHYVLPLAMLALWGLVGPRLDVPWRLVPTVSALSLGWMACTLLRGAATGAYPYPFLDAGQRGVGPVVLTMAGYVAVLVGIAAVLRVGDDLIDAARRR